MSDKAQKRVPNVNSHKNIVSMNIKRYALDAISQSLCIHRAYPVPTTGRRIGPEADDTIVRVTCVRTSRHMCEQGTIRNSLAQGNPSKVHRSEK